MRTHRLLAVAALFTGCAFSPPGPPLPGSPLDAERMVTANGLERRYLLFVPPQAATATADNPLPLVLAFHWSFGRPSGMSSLTGFDDIAAREGFLIAYPEAIGGVWGDLR